MKTLVILAIAASLAAWHGAAVADQFEVKEPAEQKMCKIDEQLTLPCAIVIQMMYEIKDSKCRFGFKNCLDMKKTTFEVTE